MGLPGILQDVFGRDQETPDPALVFRSALDEGAHGDPGVDHDGPHREGRLPAATGDQVVSEWRRDCASGCNRRQATGRSWRTDNASRALDPERGYDDVGFRLVREL